MKRTEEPIAGAVIGALVTLVIQNPDASPFGGLNIEYGGAAPNGVGNLFINCGDTGANRFQVRSNGGIANFSGNNVNLSDRREKTNIEPAKSYLDTICAIPVVTFEYADQNQEQDPGKTLGVIAQDVEAVAPEFIMESDWGTEDEPKIRKSIYHTDLMFGVMKALQEAVDRIKSLESEVMSLKS